MKDTAEEIGTLEQLLDSTIKRAQIAQVILRGSTDKLLPTILEDLFTGVQLILDSFCVKDNDGA